MNEHCCQQMKTHLEEGEVAIDYSNKFREYGIKILDGGSSYQLICFCPWCGCKLPPSLRNEWYDTLEKLIIDFDGFGDPRVPHEFNSDLWWRISTSD